MQLVLLYRYTKYKRENVSLVVQEQTLDFYPRVCIQLPIYNEPYVIERLLDCVSKIDYPADKLTIQVLDDSTDETSALIADKIKQLNNSVIKHIQRENRVGYKAGALEYGMTVCDAEFFAIFDADFLPDPNFFQAVIPHFKNINVGMVQTRWGHTNKNFSWLTRLQAFGLDAHFIIEQVGRMQGEHFINFNGTAGVWRRKTIEDAGGWQHDTLTEDLDLSYRAQLKKWRFVYLENQETPAELPIHINPLKKQQYRWTKGAAECLRKNGLPLLSSKNIRFKTKIQGLFHLGNSAVFLAILGAALLSVPSLYIKINYPEFSLFFLICNGLMFGFISLIAVYYTSFKRCQGSVKGFVRHYFFFLAVSSGLALHNSLAVLEGYFGRKTPFVRTPKFASNGTDFNRASATKYLVTKLSFLNFVELLLGFVFLCAMVFGIAQKEYGMLLFHGLLSFGYFFVFFAEFRFVNQAKTSVVFH